MLTWSCFANKWVCMCPFQLDNAIFHGMTQIVGWYYRNEKGFFTYYLHNHYLNPHIVTKEIDGGIVKTSEEAKRIVEANWRPTP